MNNQEELRVKFIQWLPTKHKEFANKNPQEIVDTLNKLAETEEGKNKVTEYLKEFTDEMNKTGVLKNGGKVGYINCLKRGGGVNCGCKKKEVKMHKNGGEITNDSFELEPICEMDLNKIKEDILLINDSNDTNKSISKLKRMSKSKIFNLKKMR